MTDYTTNEAAELLGLSLQTVSIYAGQGKFPGAYKRGPIWFIPVAAIKAYKAAKLPRGRPVTTGAGLKRKDRRKNNNPQAS